MSLNLTNDYEKKARQLMLTISIQSTKDQKHNSNNAIRHTSQQNRMYLIIYCSIINVPTKTRSKRLIAYKSRTAVAVLV